jgi:hypothetical protein
MWIKNGFEDFLKNPKFLEELRSFLPTVKKDFNKGVQDFEHLLDRKILGMSSVTQHQNSHPPPPPCLPKTMENIGILEFEGLEIARQMTLIQWELFHAIKPSEFMNQSWNRKQYHHLSPNIRKMIKFSNFVSLFILLLIFIMK